MSRGRLDLEFDESKSLLHTREALNGTLRKQQSRDYVDKGRTSSDSPGNLNIMNNGFQRSYCGRLPLETVELPSEEFLSSAFASFNLGDGLAIEYSPFDGHTSLQNTKRGTLFNPLNGTDACWQHSEDYADAAESMNDWINFVPNQLFPVDGLSNPSYLYPHFGNQSQLDWLNLQQEQLLEMTQQGNPYLQWLQSQREPQHLINAKINSVSGPMNQHEGYFLQRYRITQQMNRGLGLPYGHIESTHLPDKISLHSFPGKILKRPNSLSTSFEASNSGSVPRNDLLSSSYQNVNCIQSGRPDPNSWGLDGDIFYLGRPRQRSAQISNINGPNGSDMVPLPQDYGHVEQVKGSIYRLAKEQNGCRYLQRKFLDGRPEEVEIIFCEVLEHIVDLMTDPFGNYLVQKILQVCNESKTTQILRAITQQPRELIRIACDTHGTRSIQKVLQNLKGPEQFSIAVASLKPGMVTLMKDTNGHHVAKYCVDHFIPGHMEFIFEAAAENCVDLATDCHGCCVLQKCLGCSGGEKKRYLVYEIVANSLVICQNEFGNYVIQYVLLHIPEAAPCVIDHLKGHFVDLSTQKYSSNVVEKCIEYADEERHCHIIKELITSRELDQIMQDPYGNYVIQSALRCSKGVVRKAIVKAIKPHIHMLQTSPYGKKVLSRSCLKNLCTTSRRNLQSAAGGRDWRSFGSEPWKIIDSRIQERQTF